MYSELVYEERFSKIHNMVYTLAKLRRENELKGIFVVLDVLLIRLCWRIFTAKSL